GVHLGFGEYALRFIPLVASLLALYLFYKVAQLTLSSGAIWIAIGLAAVCPNLIYYASEVKQYSTDVLVSLALYLVILIFVFRPLATWSGVLLALAGAVTIWISHPALIVLAGAGGAAFLWSLFRRDWRKLIVLLIAA